MASRTPERVIDVVPGLVRGQKRNVRCVYDRRAKQELVSTTRVSTYPYDPEFDLEITGNGLCTSSHANDPTDSRGKARL